MDDRNPNNVSEPQDDRNPIKLVNQTVVETHCLKVNHSRQEIQDDLVSHKKQVTHAQRAIYKNEKRL